MRISDPNGKLTSGQQVGDQYVAVAEGGILLAKSAHEIAAPLATPRVQHAEVPIISTRIERNLAVAPPWIEQTFPGRRNFRRPEPLAVIRNRVVVVVEVNPAILFVSEFVRVGGQLVRQDRSQ